MIKLFLLSSFLILLIVLRVPQQNAGLASFATKTNVFGSPASTQKFLNILTSFAILLYFILAIMNNIYLEN